jgi:hypothetical protein
MYPFGIREYVITKRKGLNDTPSSARQFHNFAKSWKFRVVVVLACSKHGLVD